MARLPDVSDDTFDSEMRTIAEAQVKRYGRVLNTSRQQAHAPQVALGALAMGKALGRSGKTPARLGELLNLRVGAIVGCPF